MTVRKTRNDTDFWYCQYDPTTEYKVLDSYGNETGEIVPAYGAAVPAYANISPAVGVAQTELFGALESYDKVIVTRDMECPITEQSVLFIDKQPEWVNIPTYAIANNTVANVTYQVPAYDYIVKRVARGLDSISYAVRKVEIG